MLELTNEQFINILKGEKMYDIDFSYEYIDYEDNVTILEINVNNMEGFEYYIIDSDLNNKFSDFYLIDFEKIINESFNIILNELK